MNTEEALELLRRGRPLAASVVAQQTGSRAWVGVYPLDLSRPSTAPVLRRLGVTLTHQDHPAFRVRVIEVRESVLRPDYCVSEKDLDTRADLIVVGEAALLKELDQFGVQTGALEQPWKVDYPI